MKKFIIIGGMVLLAVVWFGWKWLGGADDQIIYRVKPVAKGAIVQTVNATGIIQPIKLVQVGTQVNGPVKKLYADFNSRVKAGEVVAQIDPALYEARVAHDKASLIRSKAELERVKANLDLAEKELVRARELAERDLISTSELDTTIASRASLAAQHKLAEASVEQSKCSLQLSEVNLEYTTIKSPVDGVVISRNVDEGQTVVASFQAQTLFVIATDLKRVKVEASIPEADIGKIRTGQPVTFTVDAYLDIEFSGEVVQVRLSPTTEQNVVIYTVIINADNPEEKLFPGMTANLIFEVAHRTDILKIPNAALRFTPEPTMVQGRPDETKKPVYTSGGRRTQVWIQTDEELLKAIPVTIGITDGSFTEVVNGAISEGQEIVTGAIKKSMAKEMINPFRPQRRRRH